MQITDKQLRKAAGKLRRERRIRRMVKAGFPLITSPSIHLQ